MMRGKIFFIALLVGSALAGLGWWQRGPVIARWSVSNLAAADDATREARVRGFKSLGEDAVAPLLAGLTNVDDAACRNLELGLRTAAGDWPVDDPRTSRTIEAIRAAFPGLSMAGKKAVLYFAADVAGRGEAESLPAQLARQLGDLMAAGEPIDDLRAASLTLAGALVERAPTGQWQATCRDLALKGMNDANVATRRAAIHLVLREPLRKDNDLLARVVPYLRDGDPSIRRVALLALGNHIDVVREEHLLPLLHDDDPEIQHLCEVVLRSRGLSDVHIRLARLISDVRPEVRLQVIPLLRVAADLDVDVWLRRLTLDGAPAVRAAAARVASLESSDDLRQRLGEMAQSDPSPTVREIARFYAERASFRKVSNP